MKQFKILFLVIQLITLLLIFKHFWEELTKESNIAVFYILPILITILFYPKLFIKQIKNLNNKNK